MSLKRTLLFSLMALTLLLLPACTGEEGSGDVTTETVAVGNFDSVDVSGIGDVTIEQTGEPSLTITTDDNLHDNITADVREGTLHVETSNIVNPEELNFQITVAELAHLHVDKVMNVRLENVDVETLAVTVDGGSVVATGSAASLTVETSGTATFNGADLESRQATVTATDVSDVVVNVRDSLDVSTSDTADVRYLGSPAVSGDSAEGGSVAAWQE